jgi:hypothetical protein
MGGSKSFLLLFSAGLLASACSERSERESRDFVSNAEGETVVAFGHGAFVTSTGRVLREPSRDLILRTQRKAIQTLEAGLPGDPVASGAF